MANENNVPTTNATLHHQDDEKNEKLVHKKGLIQTFQKLFKSSGNKKSTAATGHKQHPNNDTYALLTRSETRSGNVLQPKQTQDAIYSQAKPSINNKLNHANNVSQ